MAGKLSKIYSDALFEAALETGNLETVISDAKKVVSLYEGGNVNEFPGNLSKELEGLFSVAIEKGHADEILSILRAFLLLCEEKQNV